MKRIAILPILATSALLAGCGSTAPSVNDEYNDLYGRSTTELRFQARVYHNAPDHTIIYFKLHTSDLLYKSAGDGGPFRAAVRISYEALAIDDPRQVLDSASTLVRDQDGDPHHDQELIGSMEMRRNEGRSFTLRITARDLEREISSSVLIPIDRDQPGDRHNFLPLSASGGVPLFDDHLPPGTPVIIQCEQYAGLLITGEHRPPRSGLPAPVFSTQPGPADGLAADSTFSITVDEEGRFAFRTGPDGFYHFRPDTASANGFTLFVLNDSYPEVRTGTGMLAPLRYITSMQEFDQMSTATDRRKAVERFWLDACGERDRARDAIRIYYSRVENANRNFTSRVEGWKTDRGLVHIIFGTPNVIHRGERGETWVYGEETNLMSLSFTFTKRDDPFTDNDLVLERDPLFKGAWYRNVESWRNGRIYQN